MDLVEILKDALVYPLSNITSMVLYVILGIILGIVAGVSIISLVASVAANNLIATIGSGMIGFIVLIFLGFVISGYQLDIIKYAIYREEQGPRIDILRQFFNGVKLFAVSIIYYIIPIIIISILGIIFQHWIITIISLVLFIIFSLAQFMAQCRLAKTEDIFDALAIGEAIGDVFRVGIIRILVFVVLVSVIALFLIFIASAITSWNEYVGGALLGFFCVYLVFFVGRAIGLLYSDV